MTERRKPHKPKARPIDQTLRQIRAELATFSGQGGKWYDYQQADDLTHAVGELIQHMDNGGELPAEWRES